MNRNKKNALDYISVEKKNWQITKLHVRFKH